MQIERPRTPLQVRVKGKLVYRVGYAQMQMLRLLASLGKGERPPKGTLSATGVLREHILNDMAPIGFVDIDRKRPGLTNYYITKLGMEVVKHGVTAAAPKTVASMKAARARRKAARTTRHNGRRNVA